MVSVTLLRDAAVRIAGENEKGHAPVIYYFGDLDKTGLVIAGNVRDGIREHADSRLSYEFEHVGITPEIVAEHGLQTHPTKKDKRGETTWAPPGWDESVVCEVDAAPAALVREWAEGRIKRHMPKEVLAANKRIEADWRVEAERVRDRVQELVLQEMPELGE